MQPGDLGTKSRSLPVTCSSRIGSLARSMLGRTDQDCAFQLGTELLGTFGKNVLLLAWDSVNLKVSLTGNQGPMGSI